jgi:glycosyltransferase involved in cell wall biosynthesis
VLPAYKAAFLKQAIDSILAQTYTCFELIIVNDASPDNLDEIVSSYKDERIRYYRNDANRGGRNLVDQWNHCIGFAKGDYIVLAADDDLYHPNFLKTCVELAGQYPLADLIRARAELINMDGELLGVDTLLPEYCSQCNFLYNWMMGLYIVCIGNYMFKASVLKEKKFIDFPCGYGSDTATTVMMAEHGVANTKEMLFAFRLSSIHLSASAAHYKEKIKANTMLFLWLQKLDPARFDNDKYEDYYYRYLNGERFYSKCKYDYYNLVIKYLSLWEFYCIKDCELLRSRDKFVMLFRFLFDKFFKRG